ncbi:30S ribosomal protein S12 methylthiotransferase accessory factor YcaO [Propionivibrio limicola]|uniref:30S ribosomal protein S12 methylthiotransferase accessory factor YcaO n=1 Tax=Propionivibrio limicola TaxID=167645 RepID=UPI0012917965|nr:30S ribosomal protein S12 methylthiotransferase accessory factor YcaO [Propionivibrio limicola]
MSEHFIPGKDASLESSIRRMQDQLTRIGFHVEERSWLNPVDGIWSVHVRDRDCPLLFTNGKGASREAALASALGEFFERLSCNYFWSHYYLGEEFATHDFTHHPDERWFPLDEEGAGDQWPNELLTPDLHDFYNPEDSIAAGSLVEHNSGNVERGICALPYTRLSDGEKIWFPVNIIGNLYVSNGMSAGNSEAEARAQALSEIIERHVKFRVISEALCLPDVPEEIIARTPRIAAGIRALRDAGYGILVKDASLGGRYPVMNVTLLNPKNHGCYASFGAHPRFEIALERALTELLQGRALDALDGFPEPVFDREEVASAPNLEIHFVDSSGVLHWNFLGTAPDFEFCDWNFTSTTAEDYQWLVDLIHDEGHNIYVADYAHLGMYACRIIVPGMSEIYPVDDLEFENNSFGNDVREALLYLHDLDDDECRDLLETFNESGIDDQRPVAALIGLAPDAGSFWEDLRLGELKTLFALAIGDEEATREGCDWIRHFGQINADRRRVYRCIESLMGLSEVGGHETFTDALESLYGRTALDRAKALLSGKERFFGITAPGRDLDGCATHHQLLAAYAKVHRQHARGASK